MEKCNKCGVDMPNIKEGMADICYNCSVEEESIICSGCDEPEDDCNCEALIDEGDLEDGN